MINIQNELFKHEPITNLGPTYLITGEGLHIKLGLSHHSYSVFIDICQELYGKTHNLKLCFLLDDTKIIEKKRA